MKHGIHRMRAGADLLKKARDLYRKNEPLLETYTDLLLEWNKKINLVSRNVSRETLREHIIHSLLPVPLGLLEKHHKWIDSGSGGGLPGIPLAVCDAGKYWYLNDNVRKKMRAVDDILTRMEMKNCEVLPKSISLVQLEKGTGIVTKHAFKIPDLLKLLGSEPWKTILMWKGVEDVEEEIRRSGKKLNATIYRFDFGDKESFYEGKGIVKIER